MNLVSQSEFARMCGVSRQAVLKWKTLGRLVLEGSKVDVEATDARMKRYHSTGSPLRRTPVDSNVNRQPGCQPVDISWLLAEAPFEALDWKQDFDFSRESLVKRIAAAAGFMGLSAKFDGDTIDLRRGSESIFEVDDGDPFAVNAVVILDTLRTFLTLDPDPPASCRPAIALLARPFGTPETLAACEDC